MAKGLKFRIWVEEGLFYSYSENKGADQSSSYCAAYLRLCFRTCKKPVFSQRGSFCLPYCFSVNFSSPEPKAHR